MAGDSPSTMHGRLLEAVHISGYTFERACSELEWLLDEDRWKEVGGGFDDVHAFLATIDLSAFNIDPERRKVLAEKLEAAEASQRATAKVLGVGVATVNRDLSDNVPSGTPADAKANDCATEGGDNVPSGTPESFVQASGREIATEAQAKRKAHERRETKRAETLARLDDPAQQEIKDADGVYDVVVIDPPWPMAKIERDVRPNQVGFAYPVMGEDEIAGHVADQAPFADDCHVWLWATQKFLPMAFRLLDGWGLKYVCTFVWQKPGGFQPVGLPQYNCEFALYARCGSPIFVDTKALATCFEAPRTGHSEKPVAFYEMVRRVTGGRRLDMFNRRAIAGFDGHGNEAVS